MSAVRIIERSLSIWPECMHVWVESLGPVEEILDILVTNEILDNGHVEVDGRKWTVWKYGMHRKITVYHKNRTYTQVFVQREGIWQIVQSEDV